MRIRSFVLGAIAAVLAMPALAQSSATGKWDLSVDTPNGPFAMVFEFALDAAGKLVGSLQNEFFGSIPIKDTAINGNELTFRVTIEGAPDGAITIDYKGLVKGDELLLTSKFEGTPPAGSPAESTATATRQK